MKLTPEQEAKVARLMVEGAPVARCPKCGVLAAANNATWGHIGRICKEPDCVDYAPEELDSDTRLGV